MGNAPVTQQGEAHHNAGGDCGTRYNERLTRYLTAMRNEKPDAVPIRPFVAEFTAKYAGMDCQQVTQDYRLAFDAAVQCARGFDWDAVVANMVYVWGMIPQVLGGRYLAVPGVGLPRDTGFQYLEPPEDKAWMQPDEYDALIEDPTGYLLQRLAGHQIGGRRRPVHTRQLRSQSEVPAPFLSVTNILILNETGSTGVTYHA